MKPSRLPGGPVTLVAAVFWIVATALAVWAPIVDDEGYFTQMGGRLFAAEPLATLFFQKMHPPLAALYALPSVVGWNAALVVHAALAAAGLWFFGRTVDTWGGPGWVASAVLALSATFLGGAALGHSNTDGFFLLSLGLWLLAKKEPLPIAAGVVLAVSLWSRYEQAPYALLIAAWVGLWRRDLRFLAAFAGTVIAYVGAGALYHQDLLWVLRFPPNPVELTPGVSEGLRDYIRLDLPFFERVLSSIGVGVAAWPLALFVPWRSTPPLARVVLVAGAALAILMIGMPILGVFNFEHTPRYLLVLAPAFAVGVALSLSRPVTWSPRHFGVVAGVVALATTPLWTQGFRWGLALWPLVAVAILVAQPRFRRPLVLLFTAVAFILALRNGHLVRELTNAPPEGFDELIEWLAQAHRETPQQVVYDASMARLGTLATRRGLEHNVKFVVSSDIEYELNALLNTGNEQYRRMVRAARSAVYDGAVFACDVVGGAPRAGDLVVVADQSWRVDALLRSQTWAGVTQPVERFGRFEVLRILNDAPKLDLASEDARGASEADNARPCLGR